MRFSPIALSAALLLTGCTAEDEQQNSEFTVVAYNIENFFDMDGVAIFGDYQVPETPGPLTYSREKLLTKLTNAVSVLKSMDGGAGPDVILFQEFENDFTPESSVEDFAAFLETHSATNVREMLRDGWLEEYAGIPAVAWMAKAMADAGMSGYNIVVAPKKDYDVGIAHANAVFSRFPVGEVHFHELNEARDVIEAELLVDGNSLWVYNNHWKSGASRPSREPIRVGNAEIVRALVDARLAKDPQADIIVGGDLNSHYNHSLLFPKITTGINDVLGSQGNEQFGEADLYNLWFELPPEERYSEVWRGRRGSLMHLIVSPGLYDGVGVSYLDQSYDKLVIRGLNADEIGRPKSWHFAGPAGGGTSDHYPVYASFTTAPFESEAPLSDGLDAPDEELPHNFGGDTSFLFRLKDGGFLGALSDDEIAPYVGTMHTVTAEVTSLRPLRLQVGNHAWAAFAPASEVSGKLSSIGTGKPIKMAVTPNFWRGERQFIVETILEP